MDERDIDRLLVTQESTSHIERKLSLLGKPLQDDLKSQERHMLRTIIGAAVALANAHSQQPVYLIFGQHDTGNIAGEVAPDGRPLTEDEVRSARDRLTAQLMQCGMNVGWGSKVVDGKRVWAAELPGRPRGSWYTTPDGAVLIRSGDATYPVEPAMLRDWVNEIGGQSRADIAAEVDAMSFAAAQRIAQLLAFVRTAALGPKGLHDRLADTGSALLRMEADLESLRPNLLLANGGQGCITALEELRKGLQLLLIDVDTHRQLIEAQRPGPEVAANAERIERSQAEVRDHLRRAEAALKGLLPKDGEKLVAAEDAEVSYLTGRVLHANTHPYVTVALAAAPRSSQDLGDDELDAGEAWLEHANANAVVDFPGPGEARYIQRFPDNSGSWLCELKPGPELLIQTATLVEARALGVRDLALWWRDAIAAATTLFTEIGVEKVHVGFAVQTYGVSSGRVECLDFQGLPMAPGGNRSGSITPWALVTREVPLDGVGSELPTVAAHLLRHFGYRHTKGTVTAMMQTGVKPSA